MNDYETLLQAIEQLWPELPALIGADWPQLEAQLAPLLAQIRSDPANGAVPAAQIMALFAPHDEARIRLLMTMQELQEAAEREVIKGFTYGVTQPAAPALVTRYTDIACPRRVWLGAQRITVVVRLTVHAPQASASLQTLTLDPAQPVQVRLTAPNFILLSPPLQPIEILPQADSAPVVFDLRPDVVGHTTLTFDFAQGNQPVGTATVPVEITAYQVIEGDEPRPAHSLTFQPGLTPPDLVLQIALEKDALVFTLLREGGAWWRTFPPVPLQQASASFAIDLYRSIANLVDAEDPTVQAVLGTRLTIPAEDVDRRMKKLGQNLWAMLLPDELKALYAAERAAWANKTLLILSDEPHLPWELVWPYDSAGQWSDDAPWCGTLLMTRWLRKDGRGNGNEMAPGALALSRLMVLAPTYSLLSNLKGAQREQEMLLELAVSYGVRNVSPSQPTWGKVLDLLEEGDYDWLHVAAHGNFHAASPDGDSALWLAHDRALTPQDLAGPEIAAHLTAVRPGFFFNACQVGRQGWALTRIGGFANRLIGTGAGLFIAPQWEVLDDSALAFAREFYSALLDQKTVANAVRSARLAIRAAGDPTWLAYTVYAHPNARLSSANSKKDGSL